MVRTSQTTHHNQIYSPADLHLNWCWDLYKDKENQGILGKRDTWKIPPGHLVTLYL